MSPHKALLLAAAVEFVAPFFTLVVGANVAATIKTIVYASAYSNPAVKHTALAFIAAGMLAAIIWNTTTHALGLPASSSHSLIGGVMGAGIAAFGFMQINWYNIFIKVVLMIFLTPVIGFAIGFLNMKIINYLFRNAGQGANKFFNIAQIFNMMYLAFNHSFNDSQKSVGIILLLMSVEFGFTGAAPTWALMLAGLALALGIAFGGFKIIKTVGTGIYKVMPQHSFASQLSAGSVILLSSIIGVPVSASQIVSSSIMGVGSAERVNAVRWNTIGKIIMSWIITLPAVGLVGALLFEILKFVF
jgi:PiT family inorganic phosphate transporter